jgi:hypothetical protein
MKKTSVLIICCVILLDCSCGSADDPKVCPDASCNNYTTQSQAQAAYDADPECMQELDGDKDKIACEELIGGGGTNCPTTSNCGCSGMNKSPCESSACCKWVVNEGCKCK